MCSFARYIASLLAISIGSCILHQTQEPVPKGASARSRPPARPARNRELVLLYWNIGKDILQRQEAAKWGDKVITQLAMDLGAAFAEMKGFAPRNLKYMRSFAQAWPNEPMVQQLVALLPGGHNVRLLDMVKGADERRWYIEQTIQNGWSRR